MTDYGRGGVLGTATMLPATSATGLLLANGTHAAIIWGFVMVSIASWLLLVSYMARYYNNK